MKQGFASLNPSAGPHGRSFVGPVVAITPTHIEQRIGGAKVIRHERSRFDPDPANGALRDALRPGLAAPVVVVRYTGERAALQTVRLDAEARARIHEQVSAWADQAFRNPAVHRRFMESLSQAVDDLGGIRAPNESRSFVRYLAHESASSGARESPLERILQRHEAAGSRLEEPERTQRTRVLGPAGLKLWASLDAADVARMFAEGVSERERAQALAVVRRAPEEYQQAFAHAMRNHEREAGSGRVTEPDFRIPIAATLQRERTRER